MMHRPKIILFENDCVAILDDVSLLLMRPAIRPTGHNYPFCPAESIRVHGKEGLDQLRKDLNLLFGRAIIDG